MSSFCRFFSFVSTISTYGAPSPPCPFSSKRWWLGSTRTTSWRNRLLWTASGHIYSTPLSTSSRKLRLLKSAPLMRLSWVSCFLASWSSTKPGKTPNRSTSRYGSSPYKCSKGSLSWRKWSQKRCRRTFPATSAIKIRLTKITIITSSSSFSILRRTQSTLAWEMFDQEETRRKKSVGCSNKRNARLRESSKRIDTWLSRPKSS